ncbi:ribonuclease HI family protein [Azospira inquinata]|uniref:Ribonuclease HI family protein n=1 Tax=Azospira inquinata TaxID=2785627 RepID=A0A975SMD5_9RHOO|nr:ribonuclease HI family protein [Azospira inquinata]QWT45739.1 ribonuclease HI family protein [Azospira inquinata]QWT48938.1 ribonuclease HI family protein [Azospira inquinata]
MNPNPVSGLAEEGGTVSASRPTTSLAPSRPGSEPSPWRLWFDGSAHPNPGPMAWGVRLEAPDGRSWERCHKIGRSGCNNEAELLALEAALLLAREQGAGLLDIRGDSDFVVTQVNGGAPETVSRLAPLVERLRGLMGDQGQAALAWVPRHRNREADRLCRQAFGLPPKPAPIPGHGARRPKA